MLSRAAALIVLGDLLTPPPACVLTGALEEGPFFVDEHLNRSDLRSDPATNALSPGIPLHLRFIVSQTAGQSCAPLTGAMLDVWNCDALGEYSDVQRATGHKFLRGYQITDHAGVAEFTTVYPGWYPGRTVHVHFKIRLTGASTRRTEFTSQLFFDDTLTDHVHALRPYAAKGRRSTVNADDRIYTSLAAPERAALTVRASPREDGYFGVVTIGVRAG
jgi:protocatechuate 3,4-dioxygenase beta subunit